MRQKITLIKNWWIKLISSIAVIFTLKEVIPQKDPELFKEPDMLEAGLFSRSNVEYKFLDINIITTTFGTTAINNL